MSDRETVTLLRDCEATAIPAGNRVLVPEGTSVTITQTLGGTFTVITDRGMMVRVEARDADALGKEAPQPSAEPVLAGGDLKEMVWEQLKTVYDPEIPVNIVDLGLVYECRVSELPEGRGAKVEVEMSMTAPGCGMGDVLRDDAAAKIRTVPGVTEVEVEIVWEPPWDQGRMSEAARLQLGFE